MGLEKKFNTYIDDIGELISDEGTCGDVYRVYRGRSDKAFAGKLPKDTYDLVTNPLSSSDYAYIDRVKVSREHEYFINEQLHKIGLAPKPEGVYDVKINDVEDFYLPALVNEFDPEMINFQEAQKKYGEEKMNILKDLAFEKMIECGFVFFDDSYIHDGPGGNILYSKVKGIKILDYAQISLNGIENPFPKLEERTEEEARNHRDARETFTKELKSKLFLN